ncbi:hypothetical protein, partial [Pseudomonas shirazensis]
EDLEKVVNEALFWLEKATPRLLAARQFILDNEIDKYAKGRLSRPSLQFEFEDAMHIEIDGRKVSTFNRARTIHLGLP